VAQGDGEWELRSVHHVLSLPLLPPHTLPLLQHGVTPMGHFSTNFSNVNPSLRRQFFTNCPSVGPFHRVQPFRNRLVQYGSPMGSQVLPANLLQRMVLTLHRSTGPARILLQCEISMGSQSPSGIHLLWHGVLRWLQVEICSTMDPHGLQRIASPLHGLNHKLQGNLCSGAWSTSSPSFLIDLVSAEFSLLSPAPNALKQFFFPS